MADEVKNQQKSLLEENKGTLKLISQNKLRVKSLERIKNEENFFLINK